MGKWTDKLYITHSEWSGEVGQHSASSGKTGKRVSQGFKRLPFYCCSLSLQPFDHPVCTDDGIVFDLVNIIPYIKKYGTNPVTGAKLETKDLNKLQFHKNDNGDFYCPVTFKTFTDHTAIAAIKSTGNVFAYDTIERLNIKAKYWKDLLTDDPFTRQDIIMIQDPHNLEKRDMSNFHYLKNNLKVVDEAEEREKRRPINNINVKGMGSTAGRIFNELQAKEDKLKDKPVVKDKPSVSYHQPVNQANVYNAAHFTTGAVAESLTSTVGAPVTVNERALINEDEYMFKKIKTKGYVRIVTNFGNLNMELHCDKTPRTCYNFIMLAKNGYYDSVIFHRSIKNFMIQGGDPSGTGRGGESYFKQAFPDEFKPGLSHDDRGILSMANHGKDTNGSQFFITYRPCTHLDKKHTVFGRVVGGLNILDKMEAVPADDGDRPERTIRMKQVEVLVDPFQVYKDRLKSKMEKEANAASIQAEKEKQEAKLNKMGWFGPNLSARNKPTDLSSAGVGKYLGSRKRDSDHITQDDTIGVQGAVKKPKPSSYGNFDNW
ncbi:peptidyl-prolyl cis-trans isomerase-like 2 [Hesseltinella vesiculosa]|uniref:Peptidyl-prolyl cis-trans isomerase-like 2 n=1 Tax=Hesseltinella vesiculosa TaxID=101127 RepID=A0A1X2GA52_9FUNG|nr:peptidyl-prolyl cis-trans isomerase-like 2 [Hesseltinella vesiculosa]